MSTFSTARGVLTNVSMSGTTLIIQSRDCIASPENCRIVAAFTDTSTELVNVPFNSTIEHDVGDEVMPDTQYSITVVLVETTSNTVIDERTTSFTTPSQPPSRGPTSDNMTDCACAQMNEEDERVIVTIVSVGVCAMLLGVVLGVVATVIVFTVLRRKNTVGGIYTCKNTCGHYTDSYTVYVIIVISNSRFLYFQILYYVGHKDLSTGQENTDTELSAVKYNTYMIIMCSYMCMFERILTLWEAPKCTHGTIKEGRLFSFP